MFVTHIDTRCLSLRDAYILVRPKFCEQSVLPTSSDNFREEKREQFLLKVYIVCYFSLIIFFTVELTSFARRELCSL